MGDLTDSGTIGFSDVDLSDTHSVDPLIVASEGALGALTASVTTDTSNGLGGVISWDYSVAASAVEYLAEGETRVESFTLTLDDGHGGTVERTVNVTITGTNDAPVVDTADVTGAVTEPVTPVGDLTDSGTIGFSDVDLSDTHSVDPLIVASEDALGALTASVTTDTSNGLGGVISWDYSVAASAVEYLAKDETRVESFTLTLDDGHGGTIERTVTVTITGTNDAPVVDTADVTGAVTELVTPAGDLTDSGTIGFSDVDLSDTHSVDPLIVASEGALGTLTASVTTDTSNGLGGVISWDYSVAASAVEYLAKGETKVESFTLTLDDGHGGTVERTVNVTITGTNDAPVIEAGSGTITEFSDRTLSLAANSLTGTLQFTDADLGDVGHSATVVLVSRSGETDGLPDSSTLKSWLSIQGVDKAAGSDSGTIDWRFSAADARFDYLAKGETVTLSYTVRLNDGDGGVTDQVVDITVVGTNDAPVFVAGALRLDIEAFNTSGSEAPHTHSGSLLFADADRDDVGHTASVAYSGATGTVSGLDASLVVDALSLGTVSKALNAQSGSVGWSYAAADKAFDYLAAGEQVTLTYTVTLNDNEGEANSTDTTTITVVVVGTNDRPDIFVGSGDSATASLAEDTDSVGGTVASGALAGVASGTLSVLDLDLSNTVSASVAGVSVSGVTAGLGGVDVGSLMTLSAGPAVAAGSATGSVGWSFTGSEPQFDYLAEGETVTLAYAIKVTDNTGASDTQIVTVTITGQNDTPLVETGDVTGAVTEPGTPSGDLTDSGTIGFSDVDLSDRHSIDPFIVASDGTLGMLTASVTTDTSGGTGGVITWDYIVAASAVDYLAEGETKVEKFTLTLDDGHGGTVERVVEVTITGTNDAPVIGGEPGEASFTEGGPAQAVFADITVADVDDTMLEGASVVISGHFVAGQDLLGFTVVGNITGSYDASTGILTLSGTDTLAHYQEVLGSITYSNSSGNPDTMPRIISFSVNDGDSDSAPVLSTVQVVGLAATLDLDANDSSGQTGADHQASYGIGTAGVAIADSDTVISQTETITSAKVTLTNAQAGDHLSVGTLPATVFASIVTAAGQITVTLSGTASAADYQAAIEAVKFYNSSATPDGADRIVTVVLDDGQASSNVATSTIHMVDVTPPPAPVITSIENDAGRPVQQTNDTTPHVKGQAEAYSTVTIYANGNEIGHTSADGDGNWSFDVTSPLGDATYLFTAKATDGSGNNGASSPTRVLIVDTVAPGAPSILSVADNVGSIQGALADGASSDDTQLVVRVSLTGTGVHAGEIVQLYNGTTALGSSVVVQVSHIMAGYIDVTTPTLSNGAAYDLRAGLMDVAGNASALSSAGAHDVSIDTVAPTVTIASDDVSLTAGEVAHLTFTLSEASSNFTAGNVAVSGGVLSNFTVVDSTHYTADFTPAANSTAGATVNVAAGAFTDAAGNASTPATQLQMSVDTVPQNQAPVVISGPSSGAVTEDMSLTTPYGELIVNGSFEGADPAVRLSGWTSSNIILIGTPHSGGNAAAVYQGSGTLAQTLQTVAGATYRIQFWASNPFDAGGEVERLAVNWGGQTVFAQGNVPASGGYANYSLYSFEVVATSTSTQFSIDLQDSAGYYVLDDVSVAATVMPGLERAAGSITFTDANLGDSHVVTTEAVGSGYLGTFTASLVDLATGDGTGKVNWTFLVNDDQLQHLGAGESLTQTYTVSIDDGHGGVTTQDVDIVINGINDAPVLHVDAATGDLTKSHDLDIGSRAKAMVLDGQFVLHADPEVTNSGTTPHVSIQAVGNGTMDYYKFTVTQAGATATFDIDHTSSGFDSHIHLYNSAGVWIADNDDSLTPETSAEGGGNGLDSYLTYTFSQAGTYYIAVRSYSSAYVPDGASYELQVTLQNAVSAVTGIPLDAVNEDAGAPVGAVGTLVSKLVDLDGNGGHDNVSDADQGAITGIAVTATNSAHGTWWYSVDDGAHWQAVGSVSNSQALLLGDDARLYFEAEANWNGTMPDAISYRAWDQSSGIEGSKADTSVNGGSTAFSTSSATSPITVTDVPEIPLPPVANDDVLSFGAPAGSGWVLNAANGHYYKIVAGNFSWAQADAAAQSEGGYLATITAQQEDNFIQQTAEGPDGFLAQYLWLGGSDSTAEGQWRWVAGPEANTGFWSGSINGTATGYANWGTGEPNDWGTGEDYLMKAVVFGGQWNDATGDAAANGEVADYVGYVIEHNGGSGDGSVSEDAVTTFSTALLLANDTDGNDDTLVVTSVGTAGNSASGATVTLNNDGTISYDPTSVAAIQALGNGQTLTDTFQYTVSDGNGGVDTATVSIVIRGADEPVNQAPVARAEPYAVGRGYSFTNADASYGNQIIALPSDLFSDPDGNPLVWSANLPSVNWSFDSSTRQLTFQNNVPTGIYDITISASDGHATASQVIKVWVAGSTGTSSTANGNANHLIGANNGADTINAGGGDDFVNSRGGNDTVNGGAGNDVIYGGDGNDTLHGDGDNDYVNGEGGNDFLYGDAGNDWLDGGTGNDQLDGGTGNDTLIGGAGVDILIGGEGNDTLFGGAGADTFRFAEFGAANVDRIGDFTVGEDRIDLSSLLDPALGAGAIPAGQLPSYVRILDKGADALLQVDTTGTGNFKDVAVLTGHGTVGEQIDVYFDGVSHSIGIIDGTSELVANPDRLYSPMAPGGLGWVFNSANGHYYKFVAGDYSFDQAVSGAASQASGAYLATITDAAEADFIAGMNRQGTVTLWGGASDATTEGVWRWVTGPEAGQLVGSYQPWLAGEPNNYNNEENYVEVYMPGSAAPGWNDLAAYETSPYVAEWTPAGPNEDSVKIFVSEMLTSNDYQAEWGTLPDITGVGGISAKGATVSLAYDNSYHLWMVSYDPTQAAALQALNAGEVSTDTFTYTITDGAGGTAMSTATITVIGVNDAASITGPYTGSVTEDGTLTTGGTLTVNDVDSGQNVFQAPASLAGTYGTFSFNSTTGVWGYTLSNAAGNVQALNTGETRHDQLTVTSFDGTASRVIDVTINGSNEVNAPITVSDTASASGRYAISKNSSSPSTVNFNAASLFGGGSGPLTYSYQLLSAPANAGWLGINNGTISGNPNNSQAGNYFYRVTATDGISTMATLIALTVLPDDGYNQETVSGNGSAGTLFSRSDNYHDVVTFTGANPSTLANAGSGIDVLIGQSGVNLMNGGSGDDALYGMGGGDTLAGGAGNDFIDGGAGNDILYGGASTENSTSSGDDALVGGSGIDMLFGGDGFDILSGGTGDDTLYGEADADILYGDAGNDFLYGGSGNDILYGGAGFDTLNGGAGADRFVFDATALADASLSIKDLITDYNGGQGDVIDLSALLPANAFESSADFVRLSGSTLQVDIDGGGDSFVDIASFQTAPPVNTLTIVLDDTHNVVL
ncbi:VCBS domain-containing protein [Hoeflea marina]|uniref:VCBS domain-containing protein n=1 Tax=Hoeflea marina TaxID=274592 RepID=UPI001AECF3E1|nr:VCBS domain-containing protein [Hoeflea marina]